jgi:hypothetical protein
MSQELQIFLDENANEIRRLGKQTVENVIEIGRRLSECEKELKKEKRWLPWLEKEFNWSRHTADRFINLYNLSLVRNLRSTLSSVDLSSLYLLASPSTPESAREIVAQLGIAQSTEPLTYQEVKEIINNEKAIISEAEVLPPEPKEGLNYGGVALQISKARDISIVEILSKVTGEHQSQITEESGLADIRPSEEDPNVFDYRGLSRSMMRIVSLGPAESFLRRPIHPYMRKEIIEEAHKLVDWLIDLINKEEEISNGKT